MTSAVIPQWRLIADDLRARIADPQRPDHLPPGAALPTEEEAARLWQVSRMTARRALVELEQAGIVQPGHPRKVAVISQRVVHVTRTADRLMPGEEPTAGADSWAWDMAQAGDDGEVSPEVSITVAGEDVGRRLGISPASRVVLRRNTRTLAGRPHSLVWYWFPADLAERSPLARPAAFPQGSLAYCEARWGPLRHRARITARPPAPSEGLAATGWPVIDVWRCSRAPSGRVVVVSRAVYPADRTVLELDLWAPQAGPDLLPGQGCER
jgi:GntR family transcriptional regulator